MEFDCLLLQKIHGELNYCVVHAQLLVYSLATFAIKLKYLKTVVHHKLFLEYLLYLFILILLTKVLLCEI